MREESWREVVARHAPPWAVGTRIWTVVGSRDGREMAEAWVDPDGERQVRRWREPGETWRGDYTTAGGAEAAAALLLADGWRVAIMLPG